MLIADPEEKLQNILTTVTIENENKDFILMRRRLSAWLSQNIPVCNIFCKGERIKQEVTFKYVGFTITPGARCDTEIKKRIALSENTFTKMKSLFTNRNIRIYTKINTLKAYIWSILLHGSECWTLTIDIA